jgi:MerR family transcriptional regulator, light-induced transcriptional regulator
VCEVLCVRGWQAQLVGPSPPAAALGSFAARHEPVAVALSCSTVTNLPGAKACIDAVHGAGIPVLAGGHGFGRDGVLAEAVGADAWAPDVVTGVGILSSWVDEAPPLRRPAPEPPSDHHRLLAGRDDLIRAVASAVGAGPEASELVIHAVDTAVAGALVTRPDLLRGEVPWMERVAAGRGLPAHLAGAIVAAVERERGRGAT